MSGTVLGRKMYHLKKKKGKVKSGRFAYKQIVYCCLAGVSAVLALLFFILAFGQYEVQLIRGGNLSGTASSLLSGWINVQFSLIGVLALALSAGFLLVARHSRFGGNSNRALAEDNQRLRKTLLQKQEKLQKMFELRLIRGENIPDEEYEEYVKDFELTSHKWFSVLTAVLDLGEGALSGVNEEEVCREILKKMPERLHKIACLPPVCNGCAITAVLAGDSEDALTEKGKNYYEGLKKLAEEVGGYQILAGVSSVHEQTDGIFAAYRESINAMAGAAMDNGTKTTLPDMTGCYTYQPDMFFSNASYDSSCEEEVRSGLRTIERQRCVKALEDFCSYLWQVNRQDKIMIYVMRFAEVILFTAMEVNLDLEALYPNGLDRIFHDLLEMPEPGRIKRYLLNRLIAPILEARNRLLEKKSYSMLEEIEELIRSRKGDISLTECADILGVHPTYIWKITKAEKGQTFSDYLEKYKLEEAKRLLLNTDLTVAEIAAELNYTNAQNFIRFFNKSTGMTPGKYRKQQ